MTAAFDKAIKTVLEANDPAYTDFMARRLVEMAGYIVMGYLLILDATRAENPASFLRSANVYVNLGEAEVQKHESFIATVRPDQMANYTYND